MHEGGRRNARVIGPWKRDAVFEIREEFGSRAARIARVQGRAEEERVGSTVIEEATEVRAADVPSEDVDA